MVTYGDMMSLLLAFFILLAAYSTVNEKKLHDALESFQKVLGVTPATELAAGGDVGKVAREVQRKVQVLGKTQAMRVALDAAGDVVFTLSSSFLFDGSTATLREDANDVLQAVAEALDACPVCRMTVKGHTDDQALPSGSAYRDASDLSFARADSVARRLEAVGKLSIERFEVSACGSGQPRAANTSQEGREANRRIDIVVSGAGKRSTMGAQERAKDVETAARPAP